MDDLRILAQTQGFFTRRTARQLGYSNRTFDQGLRSGLWLRFRHGCYTFRDLWAAMSEVDRHRVRCRAVLGSLNDDVALSHISSLVMFGLDPWNYDLSRVHVTRLGRGAGRVEGDVVHHRAKVTTDDLELVEGLRCTALDRAILETATQRSGEEALCLFNQALHDALVSHEELLARFEAMSHWPRRLRLHLPIRMADARVESVGESRGMWFFLRHGIPAPEPQFRVYDAAGVLRGITDWVWREQRCLGEFDGAVKYGRLLRDGQSPGDVVFAEKRREDELRELTRYGMIRLVWQDYDRPRATLDRLHRALGMAA